MKNILWIVCLPLGLMLGAPIGAQQQASQKPAPTTSASQNQTELGKLIGIVEQMDKRLDRMENRFDRMETRLDHMETRLDHMETRLDRMETRLDRIETRQDALDKKMDAKFEHLYNRMDTMFYWFMGIISALVAPIAITLGFDTYRRLKNPSPLFLGERREERGEGAAHPPSPQTVREQKSAKQATGS